MIRRVIDINQKFIKYVDEEKCIDCVHCMRSASKELEIRCRKFGVKNLVTGSISYQKASECRNNLYLCSTFGTYFDRKYKR